MDLPRFRGSELVENRGSCPDRTLSKLLKSGRVRMLCTGQQPHSYPCKRFVDITIDGVPHLGNHIGRLGGNLSCVSTTDLFVDGCALDLPQNPSTSQ